MLAQTIFATAGAAIAYVTVGYPLWLAATSRRGRPVRREPIFPRLSIVVVVHNGAIYLEGKLRSILALDYPRDRMEILVASDGSTDATDEIARTFYSQGVRLLSLPRGGKPAALNAAVAEAHGEVLVLTDVRQPLAQNSVRLLVESFADPKVGAVSGELVIGQPGSASQAQIGLYWRFETWIRDRLSARDSMFGATGPFYAIRRSLVPHVPPDILLDDMYVPLHAFFQDYRLVMDPRAQAFDIPMNLKTEFQRKVRTLAGNYQILRAYPQLLGGRNRMWLHFMSYKVGRLVLPWLLLLLAASTFGLPAPWRAAAFAAQVAFYGLAALDGQISDGNPVKRISSPARTFVAMMIAVVRGLSILFVPPRSLWKVTSAS